MSALAPAPELTETDIFQPGYWREDGRMWMNLGWPPSATSIRVHFDSRLTDDELLAFSSKNELLRFEQEPDGDLTIMSPTSTEGSGHEMDVEADLAIWSRGDGRGRAFNSNGGFRLPDGSMRVPDAAWVSWAKLNAVPEGKRRGFQEICPEFVIEVRSENDSLNSQREKMERWMANGVELGWLIDPRRKTVEIYRSGREPEIQEGHSAAYGEGPVAGFVLGLDRIWN